MLLTNQRFHIYYLGHILQHSNMQPLTSTPPNEEGVSQTFRVGLPTIHLLRNLLYYHIMDKPMQLFTHAIRNSCVDLEHKSHPIMIN